MKTNTEENELAEKAVTDANFIRRMMADLPNEHHWMIVYTYACGAAFGLKWDRVGCSDAAFKEAVNILKGEAKND